jgi:hypothetical protein
MQSLRASDAAVSAVVGTVLLVTVTLGIGMLVFGLVQESSPDDVETPDQRALPVLSKVDGRTYLVNHGADLALENAMAYLTVDGIEYAVPLEDLAPAEADHTFDGGDRICLSCFYGNGRLDGFRITSGSSIVTVQGDAGATAAALAALPGGPYYGRPATAIPIEGHGVSPNDGPITCQWTGPSGITLASASSCKTSVQSTTQLVGDLTLTVTQGTKTASAKARLVVSSSSLIVDVGPDQRSHVGQAKAMSTRVTGGSGDPACQWMGASGFASSAKCNTAYTPTTAGTYTLTSNVVRGALTGSDAMTMRVAPELNIQLLGPATGAVGFPVTIVGIVTGGFTDTLQCTWFIQPRIPSTSPGCGSTHFTADKAGIYTITLLVDDGAGTKQATFTHTIAGAFSVAAGGPYRTYTNKSVDIATVANVPGACHWMGPAWVSFGDADACDTNATSTLKGNHTIDVWYNTTNGNQMAHARMDVRDPLNITILGPRITDISKVDTKWTLQIKGGFPELMSPIDCGWDFSTPPGGQPLDADCHGTGIEFEGTGAGWLNVTASDTIGNDTDSKPIIIRSMPPTIEFVGPTVSGLDINIMEEADYDLDVIIDDVDSAIKRVYFYESDGGGPASELTACRKNNLGSPPMNVVCNITGRRAYPSGADRTYQYTAVAFADDDGNATAAPINVIVDFNIPPVPILTSPQPNEIFIDPGTWSASATATDQDGTVVKVDFLVDGVKVCTSLSAPFFCQVPYTAMSLGDHTVRARAFDNKNKFGTSDPVPFSYKPSCNVGYPTDDGMGHAYVTHYHRYGQNMDYGNGRLLVSGSWALATPDTSNNNYGFVSICRLQDDKGWYNEYNIYPPTYTYDQLFGYPAAMSPDGSKAAIVTRGIPGGTQNGQNHILFYTLTNNQAFLTSSIDVIGSKEYSGNNQVEIASDGTIVFSDVLYGSKDCGHVWIYKPASHGTNPFQELDPPSTTCVGYSGYYGIDVDMSDDGKRIAIGYYGDSLNQPGSQRQCQWVSDPTPTDPGHQKEVCVDPSTYTASGRQPGFVEVRDYDGSTYALTQTLRSPTFPADPTSTTASSGSGFAVDTFGARLDLSADGKILVAVGFKDASLQKTQGYYFKDYGQGFAYNYAVDDPDPDAKFPGIHLKVSDDGTRVYLGDSLGPISDEKHGRWTMMGFINDAWQVIGSWKTDGSNDELCGAQITGTPDLKNFMVSCPYYSGAYGHAAYGSQRGRIYTYHLDPFSGGYLQW